MPEAQIKEALVEFDTAVKAADGNAISAALSKIEALLATHRATLHPQLLHFLEGRSYAKALLYLGGRSEFSKPGSPPGGCGNH